MTDYPLDYMDKACLLYTSAEHGCSNAPTWDLVIDGDLSPPSVKRMVGWLIRRYPTAASRVVPVGRGMRWASRFVYRPIEGLQVDEVFELYELSPGDDETYAELRGRLVDRHLDIYTGPALRVTLVRRGAARCHLLLQQHHCIADGRAFLELLEDLKVMLNLALAGREPDDEQLQPVTRQDEMAPLGLGMWRRMSYTVLGFAYIAGRVLGGVLNPLVPLPQNRSWNYVGSNRTEHIHLLADELSSWKQAARAAGASLNTLMTLALFRAMRRFGLNEGQPPGHTVSLLVTDTRPRDRTFRSFANHLASFFVDLDLSVDMTPLEQIAALHRQVMDQARRRTHLKKLVFERMAMLRAPLFQLRRVIFSTRLLTVNMVFSNLMPLPVPEMSGPGWCLHQLHITTPTGPPTAIVLTAVKLHDDLCLNVNYKASVVSDDQARSVAALIREEFEGLLAVVTSVDHG